VLRPLSRCALIFLGAVFLAGVLSGPVTARAQTTLLQLAKTSSGTCSAAGDVIGYAYEVTNVSGSELNLLRVTDDTIGTISCPSTTISAGDSVVCTGSYTVTAADIAAGSIAKIATAQAENEATIVSAQDEATVFCTSSDLEAVDGENTFDPRPQTRAVTKRFLYHRMRAMLDDEPDRPRFIRRYPGSLWGDGGGDNTPPIDIAAGENGNGLAFSTSLNQMRRAFAAAKPSLDDQAMALGGQALFERPGAAPYGGFDIWSEGHFTSFDDEGGADGDVDILYIGADYAVSNNWLVGVIGQFDWAEETTARDGSRASGDGWMVGPYVSGRLYENLFFDWRAAWGSAGNSVSPFGTYTDSFDSDRFLTTARLTGNWTSGAWRLTPSATIKYGEEDQQAYTDSNGVRIAGQTVALGRIEFGPEVGYRWNLADGTLIEPHLSLAGVWNYQDGGAFFVAGTPVEPGEFTGRLEGGVTVQMPSGLSARGAVAYDGMGTEYDAVTGKVWLNLPLN